MYQFYISSKKDAVYASKKTITKDTLPAVTQLFTPDWIVRYMAENSVGRIWMESYPDSSLRADMKYYVDEAEQTEEVQKMLEKTRYRNVNPEDIKIIEPCCGSGHILVYVFDLLFKMYEEKGYLKRDIPTLILRNNLTGLDVDKRASQLASFALIMKARSMNNRFFDDEYYEKPHVYEIKDSQLLLKMDYRKQIHDLNLLSQEERELIYYIVETFENGKTIGSLLIVKPIDFEMLDNAIEKMWTKAISTLFNVDFLERGIKRLKELSILAKILSSKYDVMITNPPYRPTTSMESAVQEYANTHYPCSKYDLYSMFLDTSFVKQFGFTSMINMNAWMFLSSYEKLRLTLFSQKTIFVMAHLGPRAFESIGGEVVQTTSFVMRNIVLNNYIATYSRLVKAASEKEKEVLFLSKDSVYTSSQKRFMGIPGVPVAYWASNAVIKDFECTSLAKISMPRVGCQTSDNDRFLRQWQEIDINRFMANAQTATIAQQSKKKWFPYNKGGSYRKWYGNNELVINWENDGQEVKEYAVKLYKNSTRTVKNVSFYFREEVTWSTLSSGPLGARYCKPGFLFDTKGSAVFFDDRSYVFVCLSYLNSIVAQLFLSFLSPTLDYSVGSIAKLPFIADVNQNLLNKISELAQGNIDLSKQDWDSFESSWDYEEHPFVKWSHDLWDVTAIGANMQYYYGYHPEVKGPLELCYMLWQGECNDRFKKLKENEEELNGIFIDIYGLQDELTAEVANEDITVRKADLQRDVKSFISYLVGIVMGRYSLDITGLAYAGGDWNASKYRSYQPDDDGIVPIYVGVGMEDGLTARITELVKLIYGEESFKENMDFIAEALGKANNESSIETLNRYLNDGFYADHLKIYQKRPIYWLFSSGKQKGFKCLIYMHRYNKDTLARINAKYYLPESTRQKIELEDIEERIKGAEGKERIRLEKTRTKLFDRYNETIEYGQVLDHMANQYIDIDLDDGVKVNYAKFQGVELVSDSGAKIKKDLLVPLK